MVVPDGRKSGSRGRRPWIALAITAVVLIGVIALGLPWLREANIRSNCRANLRSIGCALNAYTEDHDGEFPPGLAESHPDYVNSALMFKCPAIDSAGWRERAGSRPAAASSYGYVPGLTSRMPGNFILACDKSLENHDGEGRNAVFVDGHVEWWPAKREAEFERRLALQNEAVARWRASGRPAGAVGEFIGPELWKLMGETVGSEGSR